jgi:PKD repeat protein
MLSKNVCCFLIGGFVLLAICGLSFGQADQPLVAIIDASPISGPAPLSVVFDASRSTGDIMTAYWEFGDGGYAYGKRVVHTYNVQGTYVATLTVYDPAGNSAFASVTITVLQPAGQPPILTLYDPQINGLTVTINGVTQPGTPGTTITRIHWIWGDGSEGDYWFPASHTYREAGRYRIIVISFQSDGLSTASSVTVTLSEPRPSQPPSLDLFTPEIQGLTVRINGVALPGTPGTVISQIHWDWGDGSRGYQWFAASHTYASPGTYTVTVTAFQSDGLSTTRTVTVRLAGGQPPSLTLFNPEIRGLTVTINGVTSPGTPGTTIVRIQWDWGDGIREDRWFAASHTYSRPGTYTITVSSFQSDGLSTTRTVTVSLKEENKPPVADFSYSPSNPRVNETIQFTDRSYDPDGSITSWRWEFGDGSTSTLSNPSHSYSRPGTYTVWLYVTDNGGAAARASKTITIGEANRPPYEPSNPYPPHRATEIPIDISLSWSSGDPDGDPVTYDIYFGTSSPPPLIARGHSSSTYRLPKLDYNTKYYWSITASDGKVSTRGPTWEFTTGARIKRLERLAIYGPTEVQGVSGNTVSYSCTAYFDDGTQEDVTNSATWGESFDSATISRGRLTVTSDLTSTQRGEVTCSYTYNAVAKSASLSVTLLAIAQDSIFRGIILVDRPIISFYSFDISIQTILSDPSGKLRVGDVITVGGHRDSPAKVDLVAVGDLVEVKGVVVSGPEGYGVQLTEARHYVKRIGTQGNLAYFDLDYRGSPPNSDGNEQRSITAQPGAPLTLFFRYNEGNVGNQYVVRVYAEWDRTRPIANSDNDETISEVGAEIGGYRWDKEAYTAPSTPGTYKVRVVYSASATPPTWDRYDKLLAEGTITVSQPQLIATELSILLEPSMIQEGTDRVIVVKGRLVRKDNMQGIAGKKIDIFFSDWPKTAVTDSNGYYQTEYVVNLRAGSYEFRASFAGDSQYGPSSSIATLTVTEKIPRPVETKYYVVFIDQYGGKDLFIAEIGTPSNWIKPENWQHNLVKTPKECKGIGNPDVSIDGKQIVFPCLEGDNWNIWYGTLNVINYSIENAKPLIASQDREEDPKFSWDGKEIVFKKRGDIYIYDLQNNRLIPDDQLQGLPRDGMVYEDWGPFFSPDRESIVFTRGKDNSAEIFVYDRRTQRLKQLTTNDRPDRYPVFLLNNCILFSHNDLIWDDDFFYTCGPTYEKIEKLHGTPLTSEADPYPLRDNPSWLFFIGKLFSYNLYVLDLNSKVVQPISKDINILGPAIFSVSFTITGALPPPSTGLTLTIEEAVARLVPGDPSNAPDPDQVIGDQEIQQAMRLWINREPVPNTGGQVISDEKMMELFALWTKGTPVKAASASTGVALEVKQIGFTGSRFFAQGSGIKSIGVQVWDLAGKLIFSKEESGSVLAFNDRTLANGVYLYVVRVRGFDGREYVSAVRKLVIVR